MEIIRKETKKKAGFVLCLTKEEREALSAVENILKSIDNEFDEIGVLDCSVSNAAITLEWLQEKIKPSSKSSCKASFLYDID